MTAHGRAPLKRKITPANNEPLDKAIKIGDDHKETKQLNAMKKSDLVRYCQELLLKNNNLLEEKKKLYDSEKEHLVTIKSLEENVEGLKQKLYFCGDCDYNADCIHDFNDHTHSTDDPENVDNLNFSCRFCDEKFETLPEVMNHNKIIHTSNVQHCTDFLENICCRGENCWFLHNETFRNSEPSFKCTHCEQKFRTRSILREHMKIQHIQMVSNCKSEGECKYGPKRCWFVHKEDIEIAFNNAKSEGKNENRNTTNENDMDQNDNN